MIETNTMASDPSRRRGERRHARRTKNGDVRPCPKCGGPSEFNERYRPDGKAVPAWLCDLPSCGHLEIVRASSVSVTAESRNVLKASRELAAKARRLEMRNRAQIDRCEKLQARRRT